MATQTTTEIAMPAMGESVTEGTILEWLVAVGDFVETGQTVVEVSTDKVDTEVPAPAAGTVTKILVEADETVPVGTALAELDTAAEPPADGAASEQGNGGSAAAPGQAGTSTQGNGAPPVDGDGAAGAGTSSGGDDAAAADRGSGSPPDGSSGSVADGRRALDATPVASRIASAHGVDLSAIAGSGPRGRIQKEDVLEAVAGNGAPPATKARATAEPARTPLRGPAATLARFMDASRQIPTATSFRTLTVDALDERRKALKAAGKRLSFTHLIAWAIVEAAREMPAMGHAFEEVEGKPHRVEPGALSLGLAVDVEREDGTRTLLVPVVRGASELDFPSFVARYDELVTGTRDGTLEPDAYTGANVTLTNPGGLGTVASVPRLMPGQGTIVATGAIGYPPGLESVDPDRLRELGVGKVMTMTSTYDHRVIQGAESGSFLARIDALLSGEEGFYESIFSALGVDAAAVPSTEAAAAEARTTPGGQAPVTAEEPAPEAMRPSAAPDTGLLQAVQAASSLVKAHRMHGHLAAQLDPLGEEPVGDPALKPQTVNLTPELMRAIPASILRVAVPGQTFADALPHLQETYCGTIAYELEHISDHEQRVWLRQAIESGHYRPQLDGDHKRRLLTRLSEVEALETYLHKSFLGKKQFSIEGVDMLVPMLDEIIEIAAARGSREVVLGMAHRGRLNVLAHTVRRPYWTILVEFEGEQNLKADTAMPEGGTGDVKYHHGASGSYETRSGERMAVSLSPNPSHLEYVDPVIVGRARADQTRRDGPQAIHDPNVVVPVQIHGDAAFPGQGVVAETLNLQALEGYSTGGTLHIITNNQLGFTTSPSEGRSTRYASDMAKGFDVPIVHVNADDVEACIVAARLCMAFRKRFGRDALIDLIGYRRYGHNETDEPAYTQPLMYERIKRQTPVRALYAEKLEREGVVPAQEAQEIASKAYKRLADAHESLKEQLARDPSTGEFQAVELDRGASQEPETTVAEDTLRSLNEQLIELPEGFALNRKLRPQLERRRTALDEDQAIDWGHAEALAFGSLLGEGVPIRLTGQDTVRGTFSHRHLTFHGTENGDEYTPLQHLQSAEAPLELYNSPLSESGCLAFEYGYSAQAPDALVVWEAQFGDFVNGAQVIIDQFLSSGLAKWGLSTRLTLLLPHGYEGSGPEHSSGRVERFLQMAAEGNMRVANCTTPAQYFHLMRRQALVAKPRPLVVMTPKRLLRLPAATSGLAELTDGGFQPVIDDRALAGNRHEVTRLLMCTGKIYYELAGEEARAEQRHVAIARVELLYPFVKRELSALIDSYPSLEEIVWVQEEPENMGARALMTQRLSRILPDHVELGYVGRPVRAAPSEGYPAQHVAEQSRIVREALGVSKSAKVPASIADATDTDQRS